MLATPADRQEKKIPLGHIGNTKNIMNAVNYLINDDFITGSCITIDGGILSKLSIDM